MTPDTEDLLWRRFNEWFRARRPDYPSEWDAYQAGHAAAKAETAAAVAQERERAADVLAAFIPEWDGQEAVDGGDLIRMLIDAISAGAKEPSDADQA